MIRRLGPFMGFTLPYNTSLVLRVLSKAPEVRASVIQGRLVKLGVLRKQRQNNVMPFAQKETAIMSSASCKMFSPPEMLIYLLFV